MMPSFSHKCFAFVFALLVNNVVVSQSQPAKSYTIKKYHHDIVLDGKLDEKVWRQLDTASGFVQNFPTDSLQALSPTRVKIFYDDKYLYIGAKMLDTLDGDYYIRTLKRDFGGRNVDGFHVIFDTYNDYNNAFNFSITPYGTQREGLLAGGGKRFQDFDPNWDNKWFSEAYNEKGQYWSAEMKIPFNILRYNSNVRKWRANFYRLDNKRNELTAWSNVPQNNLLFNLAFMSDIYFEEDLPKPGRNLVVIPYLLGGVFENREDNMPTEYRWNIGGDAKLAITPALNLDLTFNPDFSQVEADNQQINLSRFELFFPEKRQFFIENGDLFASLGTDRTQRPFFSRRIGLATDTADNLISLPIYAGARLTGKLSQNLRLGFLNIETGRDPDGLFPNINNTATVVQQKVLASSNLTAFFLNRQAVFNNRNDSFISYGIDDFNRVGGLEFNYASSDGKWGGKAHYNHSFTSDSAVGLAYATGAFIFNVVPEYNWFVSLASTGKNYNSDLGFVPRVDVNRLAFGGELNKYPQNSIYQRRGIGYNNEILWNQTYGITDANMELYQFNNLLNNAQYSFGVGYTYTYLFDPFDPSVSDGRELEALQGFHYYGAGFRLNTDVRKPLLLRLGSSFGTYYNGTRLNINPIIRYLYRPFFSARFEVQYNSIRLPKPYNNADLWLISASLEFTLTRNIFFNSLIQYNSQANIFGYNNRFQWRFAPVSDLFIVYSENFTDEFGGRFQTRDRTIAIKLTYWLNL